MRKGILAAVTSAILASASLAQAQTVTVNSAGGADFTSIVDALESFRSGSNAAVNTDGFENVISITGFGPYIEQFPTVDDSFGTDTLTLRGDLGTTRPLILALEGLDSPDDAITLGGSRTINFDSLIVAAADDPSSAIDLFANFSPDLLRVTGSGEFNFTNSVMTALPALGSGDYATSYTQESDIPSDLIDGTREYDAALQRSGDNGLRTEDTLTINIIDSVITQQRTDPVVTIHTGDMIVDNSVISGNERWGIQIANDHNLTITNSTFNNNDQGIRGFSGATIIVQDSTFDSNAVGYRIDGGNDIRIYSNSFTNNSVGVFSISGDNLPTEIVDNDFIDNSGWGVQVFSDTNDVGRIEGNFFSGNGFGGGLQSWGYDGGNMELLNNDLPMVVSNNTFTSPSTPTDVTFPEPINVRVGRSGDRASNITFINNVFAGPATGGGVGIEIFEATADSGGNTTDITIGRNGAPTAGDGALAVAVQDEVGFDASGVVTEDAAFADATNGDWTPGNFDFAAFGDFPFSYTSQADLTSVPAISNSDDLNSLTAIVVSASGVNDGGLQTSPLAEFTNGADAIESPPFPGLLTDFPGEGTPSGSYAYEIVSSASDLANVSEIEVISGWNDGRASHHYDVYGTTDYPVTSGSSFFLIAKGVIPVPFGSANPGAPSTKEYYVTTLTDGDDGIVAEGVTGIRFDFFATGNGAGAYVDQYGTTNPLDVDGTTIATDPGIVQAIEGSWIREIDATFTTFNSVSDWSTLE